MLEMLKPLKKIYQKLRWGVLVVFYKDQVIKLFWPILNPNHRRKAEWRGNQAALKDTRWKKSAVPLHKTLFGFYSQQGIPLKTKAQFAQAQALLWANLKVQMATNQTALAHSILNEQAFLPLEKQGLKAKVFEKLWQSLEGVKLPLGSAHGDAHMGNFVWLENKPMLIDWSNYKPRNTVVYDLLHFHMMDFYKNNNVKFMQAWLKNIPAWKKLEKATGVHMPQLKVFYVLQKICHEVEQSNFSNFYPLKKHIIALNKLAKSL